MKSECFIVLLKSTSILKAIHSIKSDVWPGKIAERVFAFGIDVCDGQ
jgi:hypothetical protein